MEQLENALDISETNTGSQVSFETIENLYDQNMFLDAYRLCRDRYVDIPCLKNKDVKTIIFLGRLAGRLGSRSLLEDIFQIAREKAPEDPYVLYFAGRSAKTFDHLLRHIGEIETFPVDKMKNKHDKASFFATSGWIYALVRDFERAHRNLTMANEMNADAAWVKTCEANVLCLEDRWPEALAVAEIAWEQSPGMPAAAATLGRILAKSGNISAAASRILKIARVKQSFETLLTGIWYLYAVAERSTHEQCIRLGHQAFNLMHRLKSLTPLGDDDLESNLALTNIDIAWLLKDRARMKTYSKSIKHSFYQTILNNIDSNEASDVLTTAYQPVFQKHNTCLPTSVAAVLGGFGIRVDADALAEELTYHGTAIWRIVDWLQQHDLRVKPFVADGNLSKTLLKNNLPFVLSIKTVYHYHAMAAVGLDEAADVILIHDPSSTRMDKILLSDIGKDEFPLGPEAIAIVPKSEAHLLDLIPDAASEPYRFYLRFQKIRETRGHKVGQGLIEELKKDYPNHPFALRMEAIHLEFMGKPGSAIKLQRKLLKQFPASDHLRQDLLSSLYRTGNRSLLRNVLSQIVLKKRMPGIRATQEWRYPPAEYVAQYATYSGMVKTGYDSAVEMLWNAIAHEPGHAGSYHVLGDVHRQEGNYSRSILPYRCAASLELENNHYARAYLDALYRDNRLMEGLEFLCRRTEKLGETVAGGQVWATQIDAYEDYGYPDKAIAAMKEALINRPDDPHLLSYAVKFWGRMGFKKDEARSLNDLKKTEHRPLYFSAATSLHRMSGNWREAYNLCKKWLAEEPDNIEAYREFAYLKSMAKGMNAALELTREWMTKNPRNDEFELLYYDYLKLLYMEDLQLDVLRTRLERNPYDAWAYREFATTLLKVIDLGETRDKAAIRAELDNAVQKCEELCPDESAFLAIQAQIAVYDGKIKKAVELFLAAIRQDPEYTYAYYQAWQFSAMLPENNRKQVFARLQDLMFRCPGFLHPSKELVDMAAECYGSNEANRVVDRWLTQYPGDPELIKAKANLLLNHGQGKTDAEKAAAILEAETARFPNHADFKFILCRAYRVLQNENKWLATSVDILKKFPLSNNQRRQQAEYYQLNSQSELAAELLLEGIRISPLDEWVRYDLIALLFQCGKRDKATALVKKSLEIIPENIGFRNWIVNLLFENGNDHMAVAVARAGTKVYPDGAVLWKYYGDALWRSQLHSDLKEVELAYQKSLSFNPRFFDAADCLSELYTYQNRFEDARHTISSQKPYQVEPGDLLTRLAWIDRQAGKKPEALTQLLKVVDLYPRKRWPWRLLLEWIRSDENWNLAKTVLRDVHPVIEEDPDFVGDKLYVLHEAGVQDNATKAEWDQLLSDFPDNEKIHCLRFDILFEDEKLAAAENVLTAIEKYKPDSPYMLARKISLKADQQKFDQAIAAAFQLMALPFNVGSWCQNKMLGAFRDHAQLPNFIEIALSEWKNGMDIEPSCFRILLAEIDNVWKPPGLILRILARVGIESAPVKRLKMLLENSIERDNQSGSYTAAILDKIEDYGYQRFLIAFSEQYPDFSRTRTLVWQIIGHALVTGPSKMSGRSEQWLATWRNHAGCELWVVSNYLIAIEGNRNLERKKQLQLIFDNARDAVDTLPADHTKQYVICKYCEAALRLGQDDNFLSWTKRYQNILEDTDSGYWQRPEDLHLPWTILQFQKLLKTVPRLAHPLTVRFKQEVNERKVGEWVPEEWEKRASEKLIH